MKNTPITARVKSGMFKTKEPLLNVGPAGVDGNNKTRTMPSPSKMKGYAMKSSPFKQESQAEKNVGEALGKEFDGKGGAKATKETTTIKKGKEGKAAVAGKVIKASKERCGIEVPMSDPRCVAYNKMTPEEIRKSEVKQGLREEDTPAVDATPDEVVKTKVKGDTFRKQEGEASSAYATRNNLRKAKVAARNAKKYQRKADRAARRKDPSLSAKDQRRARKETAAASIKKVADSEMLNAQTQSAQGKYGFGTNKTTRLKDVANTAADFDKNVQAAGITDSATTTATPPKKNPFTTKKVNTNIGFKEGDVKSGFFKKKSPMKMNYFKK